MVDKSTMISPNHPLIRYISSANFMLQRMDLSKAPCDNFYLFACGNMLRSLEPLPHIYESAEAEAKAHVENILNISDVRTDDSKLLQLMKNANRECISGGIRRLIDVAIMLP